MSFEYSLLELPDRVQGGDVLSYKVMIQNVGDSTAHDIAMRQLIAPALSFTSIRDYPVAREVLRDDAGLSNGWRIYDWRFGSLDPGRALTFVIGLQVGNDAIADSLLPSRADLSWSSQPGRSRGERAGTGQGADNYRISGVSDSVRVAVPRITFDEIAQVSIGYQIGEIIDYRLIAEIPRVTLPDVRIVLELGRGLGFADAQLEAKGLRTLSGAALTGRMVGDQNAVPDTKRRIEAVLGDVVVAAKTGRIVLTVSVRVADLPNTSSGQSLGIGAWLSSAPHLTGDPPTLALSQDNGRVIYSSGGGRKITVREPGQLSLRASLVDSENRIVAQVQSGDRLRYEVVIANPSNGAAHDIILEQSLSRGFRLAPPRVLSSETKRGSFIVERDDSSLQKDGLVFWRLRIKGGLAASESAILLLETTVDGEAGAGEHLEVASRILNYHSAAEKDSESRRAYGPGDAGKLKVVMPAPKDIALTIKAGPEGDRDSGNVGEAVTYTVYVPATPVAATLYNVNLSVEVSEIFVPGTIEADRDALIDAEGLRSSSEEATSLHAPLTAQFKVIPPGERVRLTLRGHIANRAIATDGIKMSGRARFTWSGSPTGAPHEVIEAQQIDPIVITEPKVAISKLDALRVEGNVSAGSEIRRSLTIVNRGSGPAHDIDLRLRLAKAFDLIQEPGSALTWNKLTGNGKDEEASRILYLRLPAALAPGQTATLPLVLRVNSHARPLERLGTAAILTWASRSGKAGIRRDGSSRTPSDAYIVTSGAEIAQVAGIQARFALDRLGEGPETPSHSSDVAARALVAVGDRVTHRLQLNLPLGTITGLKLYFAPEPGLRFDGFRLETNGLFEQKNAANVRATRVKRGGKPMVLLSFDPLVSKTGSPTITVFFNSRVLDHKQVVDGKELRATVEMVMPDPNGLEGSEELVLPVAGGQHAVPLVVVEPGELRIAIVSLLADAPQDEQQDTAPQPGASNGAVLYQIAASNPSDVTTWNVTLSNDLPLGMRGENPILLVSEIDGRLVDIEADATAYAKTGRILWKLPDGEPLRPGETLTLSVEARIDDRVSAGSVLTVATHILSYFSQSGTATADRRRYKSAAVGRLSYEVAAPETLGLQQITNAAHNTEAVIGSDIEWQVTIPDKPSQGALPDLRLNAVLSAGITVASVQTFWANAPAGGAPPPPKAIAQLKQKSDGSDLSLRLGELAAGRQVTVRLRGTVGDLKTLRDGSVIATRFQYSWGQWPDGGRSSPTPSPSARAEIKLTEPRPEIRVTVTDPALSKQKVPIR